MEVFLINDANTIDLPPPELVDAAAMDTGHLPQEEGLHPCLWVPLRGMIRIRLPFALHRNPENRNLRPACLTVTLVGKSLDGHVFYNTSEYVWVTGRFANQQEIPTSSRPPISRELDRIFEVGKASKVPHLDFPFTIKVPSTLPPSATPPVTQTVSSLDDLLLRKRSDLPNHPSTNALLSSSASIASGSNPTSVSVSASASAAILDRLAQLDPNLALWAFASYHVTATMTFQSFSVCAKQTTQVPAGVGIRVCYPRSWMAKEPLARYLGSSTNGAYTYAAEIPRLVFFGDHSKEPINVVLALSASRQRHHGKIDRIEVGLVRRYRHMDAPLNVHQCGPEDISSPEPAGPVRTYKPPFPSAIAAGLVGNGGAAGATGAAGAGGGGGGGLGGAAGGAAVSLLDFDISPIVLRVSLAPHSPDSVIGYWRLEHYIDITIHYRSSGGAANGAGALDASSLLTSSAAGSGPGSTAVSLMENLIKQRSRTTVISLPLRVVRPGVWDDPDAWFTKGVQVDPAFRDMPPPQGWTGHDREQSLQFARLLDKMWGDQEVEGEGAAAEPNGGAGAGQPTAAELGPGAHHTTYIPTTNPVSNADSMSAVDWPSPTSALNPSVYDSAGPQPGQGKHYQHVTAQLPPLKPSDVSVASTSVGQRSPTSSIAAMPQAHLPHHTHATQFQGSLPHHHHPPASTATPPQPQAPASPPNAPAGSAQVPVPPSRGSSNAVQVLQAVNAHIVGTSAASLTSPPTYFPLAIDPHSQQPLLPEEAIPPRTSSATVGPGPAGPTPPSASTNAGSGSNPAYADLPRPTDAADDSPPPSSSTNQSAEDLANLDQPPSQPQEVMEVVETDAGKWELRKARESMASNAAVYGFQTAGRASTVVSRISRTSRVSRADTLASRKSMLSFPIYPTQHASLEENFMPPPRVSSSAAAAAAAAAANTEPGETTGTEEASRLPRQAEGAMPSMVLRVGGGGGGRVTPPTITTTAAADAAASPSPPPPAVPEKDAASVYSYARSHLGISTTPAPASGTGQPTTDTDDDGTSPNPVTAPLSAIASPQEVPGSPSSTIASFQTAMAFEPGMHDSLTRAMGPPAISLYAGSERNSVASFATGPLRPAPAAVVAQAEAAAKGKEEKAEAPKQEEKGRATVPSFLETISLEPLSLDLDLGKGLSLDFSNINIPQEKDAASESKSVDTGRNEKEASLQPSAAPEEKKLEVAPPAPPPTGPTPTPSPVPPASSVGLLPPRTAVSGRPQASPSSANLQSVLRTLPDLTSPPSPCSSTSSKASIMDDYIPTPQADPPRASSTLPQAVPGSTRPKPTGSALGIEPARSASVSPVPPNTSRPPHVPPIQTNATRAVPQQPLVGVPAGTKQPGAPAHFVHATMTGTAAATAGSPMSGSPVIATAPWATGAAATNAVDASLARPSGQILPPKASPPSPPTQTHANPAALVYHPTAATATASPAAPAASPTTATQHHHHVYRPAGPAVTPLSIPTGPLPPTPPQTIATAASGPAAAMPVFVHARRYDSAPVVGSGGTGGAAVSAAGIVGSGVMASPASVLSASPGASVLLGNTWGQGSGSVSAPTTPPQVLAGAAGPANGAQGYYSYRQQMGTVAQSGGTVAPPPSKIGGTGGAGVGLGRSTSGMASLRAGGSSRGRGMDDLMLGGGGGGGGGSGSSGVNAANAGVGIVAGGGSAAPSAAAAPIPVASGQSPYHSPMQAPPNSSPPGSPYTSASSPYTSMATEWGASATTSSLALNATATAKAASGAYVYVHHHGGVQQHHHHQPHQYQHQQHVHHQVHQSGGVAQHPHHIHHPVQHPVQHSVQHPVQQPYTGKVFHHATATGVMNSYSGSAPPMQQQSSQPGSQVAGGGGIVERYVIAPHTPASKNEIALRPGDRVLVVSEMNETWCFGQNVGTRQFGAFPLNCLGAPTGLTGTITITDSVNGGDASMGGAMMGNGVSAGYAAPGFGGSASTPSFNPKYR
ncbi:hypothetical protein HDU96_005919 [Phlyctochytrium bullatum]|nr:hypothetical protein HDU96_005919 [Phlyctochytrium bullatum]